MILRTLKCLLTTAVLWNAQPYFYPHFSNPHDLPIPVLQYSTLYLKTLLLVTALAKIWALDNVLRACTVLLLYTSPPFLLLAPLAALDQVTWDVDSQYPRFEDTASVFVTAGVVMVVLALWLAARMLCCNRPRDGKSGEKKLYGLKHGVLHLDAEVPMWMNMGYWKTDTTHTTRPKTLAEACRDLLNLVLSEAGLAVQEEKSPAPSRFLLDVGFGCGEQTIHLMSDKPVRPSDRLWWDEVGHQVLFDRYVGITQDAAQCTYAQQRVSELSKNGIKLFCADAAKPQDWNEDVKSAVENAKKGADETWLLALDTAYHFKPSRWELVKYAHDSLEASFMAFDLCLAPGATRLQKLWLRALTKLMGAPWMNFETVEGYKVRLREIGYEKGGIKMVDISEHVFSHLADHLERKHRGLGTLGLGIGSFRVAKWLFEWWGTTGLVRGVVVVARHEKTGSIDKGACQKPWIRK